MLMIAAAPPPEPKRFTDEELKQQYGIHLATRLQSDDPGKQANWADIDDDDDDWAPETIEWTDGTKITLPQPDEQPPPTPEPAPVTAVRNNAVQPSSSPVPPATASPLLKSSGLSSGRTGLVLKGVAEKPTLVAKPPGPPTPVKSPWAPLPPIDKVAPVVIDIPQPLPQQGRFLQRDPHGFQNMPPPPAKEIAADDFSRSWREGNTNTSKELYNSRSGRYEPVTEIRRGARQDSRQPAVLQRPSQQDGPAEPSPAFQTHRASGQDGAFGRRRTSSNVSGGSGNYMRRMSRGHDMPPPHELMGMRRGSLAAVSDAPSSPRNYPPSDQQSLPNQLHHQNQNWQSRASPVISHPSPQSTLGQTFPPGPTNSNGQAVNVAPFDDPVERQKLIMRQTREEARRRKQEEEAKEEAAKQERIRLKLEALGPAPAKKSKEDKPAPTQIQQRESNSMAVSDSAQTVTEVGPKVKTRDSDIKADQESAVDAKHAIRQGDTRVNGVHQVPHTTSTSQISHDTKTSQPWQTSSASTPDRSAWSSAPQQRNVWATNDRTLGNGTFDSDLSSKMPEVHQPTSKPGPIGPPTSHRDSSSTYQQSKFRDPFTQRPTPIGPPNKQGASAQDQQRAQVTAAWQNLSGKLQQEDAAFVAQQKAEIARQRELVKQGRISEIQPVVKDTWRQVNLKEDGTRGGAAGAVTTIHNNKPAEAQGLKQQELAAQGTQQDTSRTQTDAWKSTPGINAQPVRGSRFFPTRDVRLEESDFGLNARPGSPSPPPPTMLGHPAYDGDVTHPHVSLPRPNPVVRLPPALSPIGPPKPTNFAAAAAAPPPLQSASSWYGRQDYASRVAQSSQDVRRMDHGTRAGDWQNRIDSLIGRKVSPKMHTLTVDSSSKHALDLHRSHMAATVSLPISAASQADNDSPISKPPAEECFEEQEMGSLPAVKFPHMFPPLLYNPAPSPSRVTNKKVSVEPASSEPFDFTLLDTKIDIISIRLPGQVEAKTLKFQGLRTRSNPRRGNHRGSSHPSSSYRGGRGRDASGSFPSPNPSHASASSGPSTPGRGRGRGRGNWNRHVSTPVHSAS